MTRSAADGAAAPSDLSKLKDAVRKAALARRDALDPASRAAAGARLAELVAGLGLAPGALVSGFWPIRSEIDPRPAMELLAGRGHGLALPVIVDEGARLIFRRWRIGDRLVAAGFGLSEPGPEAEEVAPDVLLVPLAAFDRNGDRIGYGRGYYDGAIARLEAERPRLKIGVAFSVQEAERVPTEPHDRRLDLILTEAGPVRPVPEMP